MKHPSLKSLQNYFDGDIDLTAIKPHLESCDRCSSIIAQMAKVDIYFTRANEIRVSPSTKESVFSAASGLLKEKRNQIELHTAKREKRREQKKETVQKVSRFFWDGLPELKMPLFHCALLCAVLLIFTKVSLVHKEVHHYKIIENDTVVTYSELQGENDEDS